jgi:hypothetical protein
MPIKNALAQRPANMLAYQDTLSATPRNEYLGALADLIAQSYSPQRTQQMQGTARFLSMPAISQTLDRLSYGEPLTTGAGGLGGTTRVRPEALEAAMAVAPAAQPVTMATLQAARAARQAALQAGRAGERYAERVVPGIMERGGLPAQMLQDLAQGTRRQIFVGEKSKNWNAANAAKAVEMEKAGVAPEEIWSATGTFRGPEGKLRQEISDQGLKINDYRNTGGAITINHPELQAAYEQIPRGVKVRPSSQIEGMAAYEAPKRELDWQLGEGGVIHVPSGERMPTDIYAHELQHAVQAKEGFARGGSPSQMILVLEDLAKQKRDQAQQFFRLSTNQDPLNPQIIKPGARKKGLQLEKEAQQLQDKAMLAYHSEQVKMDLYNQLAGEAEARAVQSRMSMTPQQRLATFPYKSYDVPVNQLIVRTR